MLPAGHIRSVRDAFLTASIRASWQGCVNGVRTVRMHERSTHTRTQTTGLALTLSVYRISGSIGRHRSRFWTSGAAPGIFFISAGYSVTKVWGSIRMTNLFSEAQLNSSASAESSRASTRRNLCRISANDSISLPRIAYASTGSHVARTVGGLNGQKLIGNSSSTISAQDCSNLTGDSFWSSIGAPTVLHFSPRDCARSLNRKARGLFVGRPCLPRIRLSGRDSNGYEFVGQAHRLPFFGNRSGCPTTIVPTSQFPVGAIPAQKLLNF
jgi:hypothetical protein